MRSAPTIIHESYLTPGLANKLATKFAKKVLTTFPETLNYLPEKKAIHVGAVIREDLFTGNSETAYAWTKLSPEKPIILIMGGSSGSEKINRVVRENVTALLVKAQIIHICGNVNMYEIIELYGYRIYYNVIKE